MEHGLKSDFVDAKDASRTCPICGEVSKLNGRAFICKKNVASKHIDIWLPLGI
ncbi:MAG: transposase [Candidatus Freyarchaeota archaeon]|nr:transposase [Candidatus Jordarchaeia archaeon]